MLRVRSRRLRVHSLSRTPISGIQFVINPPRSWDVAESQPLKATLHSRRGSSLFFARAARRVSRAQAPLEITLDPRFTPSENAQKYFRRYKKLKRRASTGLVRLQEMEEEEKFLGALAFDLETADEVEDVLSVEEALAQAGYAGRRGEKKAEKDARTKGRQPARARPYRRFASPAGWEVIVGKNAMGNDEMLKSVGRASDTWLHARGVPGSHVLLRRTGDGSSAEPDAETLAHEAAFAAYFSRGRTDSKLTVAYLPFSHLRKPKGRRPGQVLIGGHETILVDPDLGRRLCEEWEEVL